ncbi:MAG: N-6 DNA methylase, partial [Planctomycetaceae bacterium]|nr:N-6 DNA methylase [Planctomycetaceae bacterium]
FVEKHKTRIKELDGEYDVEGIIRLLSKYKYKLTVDNLFDLEYTQTIDPEFIGKVFESLLACIDADTKENRRKTTGSFYTPREIVDYMVSESLDSYLQNDPKKNLLQCKILDPACGSGAFPCGVMNEIIRRIDPDKKLSQNERYHKKLEILKKVIYGVDLQPIAVQITVLRLFLSLIQEIIPDKKKDNYGIEPLPNLETKFVCANTLIGLKKDNQRKLELPAIQTTIKQLFLTREQHITASTLQEKKRLQEYDESLRKTLSILMKDTGDLSHETADLLLQWNPYDQTKSTPFFDPQWMFGVTDGFDIVIGNPPYVESRSASISDELKKQYQNQVKTEFGHLSQYITKGSDLLIYFFPRSMTLLNDQGIGILIVQNGWLNTDYGVKTTQFLIKTLQYIKITDSPFRHFYKQNANVNTVIAMFKKQSEIKKICFDMMDKESTTIAAKNEKSFNLQNSILSDLKWGMIMSTDNEILSVLTKVIRYGKKIDQSFYSVGQGINVNRKTFISKDEKSKFCQKENIINAVFKEYEYVYSDFSYFLYHSFKPNKHDRSIFETINAEEFGAGKSFTRQYPVIIMPRGIGSLHFAGLLQENVLSNSFVDVYIKTPDDIDDIDDISVSYDDFRQLKSGFSKTCIPINKPTARIENSSEISLKILNVWLFCNSSLFFLYREISGRKNLGGGLLKSEAADIKLFPLYFPIAEEKNIRSIINKMGTPCNLQDRLQTAIQQQIDHLIFSYFEIPFDLQTKILNELLRLFLFRSNRAKDYLPTKEK